MPIDAGVDGNAVDVAAVVVLVVDGVVVDEVAKVVTFIFLLRWGDSF